MSDNPQLARRRRKLGGIIGGTLVIAAAVVFALSKLPDAPPAEPPAGPSPDEDPPTLAGALAKASQWTGNDTDATTARSLVLLGWANRHLRWSDVEVAADETRHELVQKSTAAQFGKRMCVSGKVVRLNLVRTDSASSGSGSLVTSDGKPFVFMAARNGGSVGEQTTARLCGAVTGWNDSESDLGPPHAVVLVGMFEADREPPGER